ncbi:response regulator transcription factor [Salaquimonas pukyongi]|uniref:response regulator transcription factor n=1 Tax=Salaquimonas pukyongi TaxID=2712698 RepID=UPI00096B85CB|nr:response regulator transcription factor [Salaquimonas pukyongi]
MQAETTILVADDHPLFREALENAVDSLDRGIEVRTSGSFEEAVALLDEAESPDLLLLDLNMPGSQGVTGLTQIRARFPAVPVIVISATEDVATIRKSIALGASGYVPKSSGLEDIRKAIIEVLDGKVYVPGDIDLDAVDDDETAELIERLQSLTPQQTKVLGMLAEGLLNKQIAYELGVSEATVKAHVSAILLKLKVDSRTQAVIAYSRLGGSAA